MDFWDDNDLAMGEHGTDEKGGRGDFNLQNINVVILGVS